jgi:SET domain-containing protein
MSNTSSVSSGQSSSTRKQQQSMLAHLALNVKCRLGTSGVHGVGVFAVVDIAAGSEPFRSRLRRRVDRVDLTMDDMLNADPPIPPAVQAMVANYFFVLDSDATASRAYPVCDLNAMDLSFYINHQSGQLSNVAFVDCQCAARCAFEHIVATRDIAPGDELFLDYGEWTAQDDTITHDDRVSAT